MTTFNKSDLLSACIARQQENVNVARDAMFSLREIAQSERSSEELTDAFSAQCHNDQAMYARRMEEANGMISILERARSIKPSKRIGFGSLIVTDKGKFFVAAGIGQFEYNDETFLIISNQSPIYQAMEDKAEGDSFQFRERNYTIQRIM